MDEDRIRIWPKTRTHWQYKNKPVLLLGGSDEDNLFNHPNLWANLDALRQIGGNYVRMTLSSRDPGNVWPYEKVAGKYDLNQFNAEWWDRLRQCIEMAQQRDIIVQIEFWATFDFYRDCWLENPFNPALNGNYTADNTKLAPEWPHHPARKPQPFFHSVPELNNDIALLDHQKKFVRNVLEVTLPFENVLYCLDNETATPPQWAWYWAAFIRKEAADRGTHIELTEMWDSHDITHDQHKATFDRPDLFSFADVSQNNWQDGRTHYDNLMAVRSYLAEREAGPCPMNNVKVYARLHAGGEDYDVGLDRWWQNVFAGCASTRFHRPPSGSGLDQVAQQAIHAARVLTDAFDVFACRPRPDLLAEAEPDEIYCLAEPAVAYAVYFSKGGSASVRTTGRTAWRVRWLDPRTGQFGVSETTQADAGLVKLAAPDDRPWTVLVYQP